MAREDLLLEVNGITKRFGGIVAVENVSFKVHEGEVISIIGPNGAGKTTFLRLVTGLAFPTSGTLSLWGNSGTEELQKQRKRIGSMIETPALFPSMTAYQNMEVQRIQRGIPDKSVIKRTLDMVGLQDTGKKSVRNFSLGMRQRLGIAIALSGSPDFLILDEPINGLDPQGIIEIRELILKLNHEHGITVLISSHILDELSRIATHFGFIDKGQMIQEISALELNTKCRKCVKLTVSNMEVLCNVLTEKGYDYSVISDKEIDVFAKLDITSLVVELAKKECNVLNIQEQDESLENYYINLIGGNRYE